MSVNLTDFSAETKAPRRPILGGALDRSRPLVPCPSPDVLPKAVAAKFAEADTLAEREQSLRGEAYDAEQGLARVRADEAQAASAAVRAGRSAPASKVPAIEEEIASKRADAAALKIAAREVLAEAIEMLKSDGSASAHAESAVDVALDKARAAGDAFAESLVEVEHAFAGRRWVASVSRGSHPDRTPIRFSTALAKSNGTPVTVSDALGAIAETVAEMIARREA